MGFPADFLWGASTSGFQSEMGDPERLNVDCNSDWFLWVHDKTNIQKGIVSGDFPEDGIDSWNSYERDHNIALKIGLNAYRIGVEWSRIFPKSTATIEPKYKKSGGLFAEIEIDSRLLKRLDKVANKSAVIHYREVVKDLRKKYFKVFVCLNHFTLPLWIHNPVIARDNEFRTGLGGWVDQDTIVEFTKYAAYLAWKLGDLVDKWATFNEPMVIPELGYTNSLFGFPPGVNNDELFKKVVLNLTVAHARAYDAIKLVDRFKAEETSSVAADVGFIHNVIPAMPLNAKCDLDVNMAELFDRIHNHFMLKSVCEGWLDENFNGCREKGETKENLRNKIDWLGVNYYTRSVFKGEESSLNHLSPKDAILPNASEHYGFLCQPNSVSADGNPTSDFGWEIYPEGLLYALSAVQRYKLPLYVMENGVADKKDIIRPKFITEHIETLDYALNKEKVDVKGYFHWSLIDNYEWAKGFNMKFGLYEIEPNAKKCKPKKSAETYADLIAKYKPHKTTR